MRKIRQTRNLSENSSRTRISKNDGWSALTADKTPYHCQTSKLLNKRIEIA